MSLFGNTLKTIAILAALGFLALAAADDSWARAGGSKSSGSAGSRSSSTLGSSSTTRPSTGSTSQPAQPAQPSQTLRQTTPQQQPASGGFMRGLAGGLAGGLIGGMIGNMLFGGASHAAGGSFGGGGIGLFDILLIGGGLYLLWRFLKKRKAQEQAQSGYQAGGFQQGQTSSYQDASQDAYAGGQTYAPPPPPPPPPPGHESEQGLAHVRSMDPTFDTRVFIETVSDIFFQIQAAWGKRALEPIRGLLTEEMFGIFTKQVQEMLAQGRTNKLENVSVRSVEVTEAWQEQGNDYITVRFFANLLDYTIDDNTGQVLMGSDSAPVKFEEFWTFTRPVGPGPWRLSAINQVN